ncbi:hypothetical protein M9Y10_017648 [Tritrichomonas musculus]|uniref:Uncharacterized protein n=1 Tax=Tritrichomonas musculus TaxID=1915356 RepID=A0ABR2HU44_9EUKA
MQHPLLTGGSAFRSKLPKEPTTKDIESAIVTSGLLGKKPTQYKIKYSKPSLADQKPPQQDADIWFPSNRNNGTQQAQTRPSTAMTTNRNRNNNLNYYNYNSSAKNNTPRTTRTPRATRKNAGQRPQTPSFNNGLATSSSTLATPATSTITTATTTARSRIAPSSSQSEKIILKPDSNKKKNAESNTVFYGRVLNSSEPPSSVNFIQLNEILTRLLQQQERQDKIMEKIERIRKKREMKENREKDQQESSETNNDKKGENEGEITSKEKADKNDVEITEEEEEADKLEEEEEEESFPEDFFADIENIDINHIYYNIFGEVIRQYFVECTAQGDLLSSCRTYFNMANIKIPQIKKHYDDIIDSIVKKTIEDREAIKTIGPEIESNEKRRLRLQQLIEEFRTDLKILTDHHDVLMNQLGVAFRELSEIQQSVNQLNSRLANKNRKLMELIEELRSLDSISASYTSDTIRFAENLRQLRVQQESGRKQIQINQVEVDRLKDSIQIIDNDIVKFTEDIENSRIKPIVSYMGIQVDLVSRRLFKEPRSMETVMKETAEQHHVYTGSLFQKVRDEFNAKNKKFSVKDEGIVLDSYEDYSQFKQIILKYEQELHMSSAVIESAEKGEFKYNGKDTEKSLDFIKLFASNLSKNIVNDAIQNVPYRRIHTQTLVEQQEFQLDEEQSKIDRNTSPLLSLIDADYSQRAPQSLEWLLAVIRELYNAKTIDDEHILSTKSVTDLKSFPRFIYQYFHKKHKIQFFADQLCWDVYITSHEHKERSQEIDVFIGFLDEEFNAEQLAFFLIMRGDCLKVGSSVSVFTRDSLEQYNEYFLADDQIDNLLRRWWFDRYKKEYFNSVMEMSIPRPAIFLESTKRYVGMNDFLIKNIMFYSNDAVERLNELLIKYRIKPRLTLKQFKNLVKITLPELSSEQAEEFYRSTVTKSKERTNIDIDSFYDKFNNSSVIMVRCRKDVNEDGTIAGNNNVMLQTVENRWQEEQSKLNEIFEFFQKQSSLQPDNLTLKTLFDDAARHLNNLNHSIALNDGEMATVYYYQFMFSLDALFSAITYNLEPDSLISIECSVRESWLEKAC